MEPLFWVLVVFCAILSVAVVWLWVLFGQELQGQWTGKVFVLLGPGQARDGIPDGTLSLRPADEIRGFRLLDVLPGKLPLIALWENYESFKSRPLDFRLEAFTGPWGPYVEVLLHHSAGQPPTETPTHSVMLKVWPSARMDAVEFEFQWQPVHAVLS